MPGFGDMVQKAFYLGVGLASYASEQVSGRVGELQERAQKLADELVERGEMSAEEAQRFMREVMEQGQAAAAQAAAQAAQANPADRTKPKADETSKGPRRIEILDDDEEAPAASAAPEPATPEPEISANTPVEDLRGQVDALKEELKRLRRQR